MRMNTAAISFLEKNGIPYSTMEYPENGPVAAKEVAAYFNLGDETDRLFKTLVTSDRKGGYYVFCLPVEKKLDLKKAASLVGAKNLQMVEPEVFQTLTGYTHGGCSPFGMRTELPTIVDHSAVNWETIYLSGGRIGLLIAVSPDVLTHTVNARFESISKE